MIDSPDKGREEWRAAPGFEGFYEVSDLGRVRSLYFSPPRMVSQWPDKDGYPCVTLGARKRRKQRVHRLVALAFHGRRQNVLHNEVAHLDGCRSNCRADNLKWVSRVENHSHKLRHGTHQVGELCPAAKLRVDQVARIKARYATSREIAEDYGISRHTVFDIWRGKTWIGVELADDPGRIDRIIAMGEQAKRLNEESKHDGAGE